MNEQFGRVRVLIGNEACDRLARSHVVVVGFGAVGSFAAEALVRSGIGHVRIMDADVYEPTNMNRQLGADTDSMGQAKVEVGGRHLKKINPGLDLECVEAFIQEDSVSLVTRPFDSDGCTPDVIIDAIDTIDAKLAVLVHCHRLNILTLSSMGAARKIHPELIRFGDISGTEVCPLAREVRKRLRKAGIASGIKCVYSLEHVVESTHASRDPGAVSVVHRPQLGSLVTVTGSFGLRLAAECMHLLSSMN